MKLIFMLMYAIIIRIFILAAAILIALAAGLDAKSIIWIVKEVRENIYISVTVLLEKNRIQLVDFFEGWTIKKSFFPFKDETNDKLTLPII